jgi:hypothetical protein
MSEITGSCRCGKVTYSTSADPVFTGVCHCGHCQKSSGSAFGAVVAVPTPSLTITGTTKRFTDTGDSGSATHRDFCLECGSTLTQSADLMPGITMLTVGTLDDTGWVKPAMQIYCDSAQPWVTLGGGIQSFAKMPG